jgi:tetratricopeptide (TPR) repeat protein
MRSTIFAGLCLLLIFLSLPGCLSPENQHVRNGDYYFEQEDWTLAISEYEKALAINPEIDISTKLAASYLNRAIDFTYRRQWASAIEDIEKAQGLSPDIGLPEVLINAYLGIADDFTLAGDWREARKYYKTALEIDSKSVHALNNLGHILCRQGFYEEALTYLDEAIMLDSENKNAYINRFEVLISLDYLDSAMLDANELIELYPESIDGYYLRISLNFLKHKLHSTAISSDIKKIATFDLEDAESFRMRGNAYMWYSKWDEAKADFDRAIELEPGFREAYLSRANLYFRMEQYDLATEDADKIIALSPDPHCLDDLSLEAVYLKEYCKLYSALSSELYESFD